MTIIEKEDGTKEPFKPEKLRRSLHRAGASADEIRTITKRIQDELHAGMKTSTIYRHAFEYLRKYEKPAAARYGMRRALFTLGPTGFPFEDFLARLFATEGYKTRTGIMIEGRCAKHEIDVAAYKPDHSFAAEAKFHARPGLKSDLKVALYCRARQLDLAERSICDDDTCGIKDFYLITNTKFTSSAQNYANCVGLKLLSWDFPRNNTLHDRIKQSGLYPVTALTDLSNAHKRTLIERNIIVCKDIIENPNRLRHLHLSKKKFEAVLSEARQLCAGE